MSDLEGYRSNAGKLNCPVIQSHWQGQVGQRGLFPCCAHIYNPLLEAFLAGLDHNSSWHAGLITDVGIYFM